MKKKLWLSILIITVVCALFLTACDRDDVKDVIDHVTATKTLSVPSGLRIENNYLKWNPVEYASRYIVSINGNENYCDDYQYGISSLRDGAYTFMVKACGDDVIYKSSEYSAKLTVELVDGASASNGYYSQFDDLTKNESFLGYGFDVINSSLFNDQVVKTSFPIFNQEKLMQQRLLKVDSKKSTVEEIASSDMESFMQDWNASLNVNVSWGLKKIGGSVGVEAKYSGGSSTAKSKYYHAINIKNQKFYIVMQSDMDTYKSIVSDGFKNDLMSNMEPAELFNKYGTHFITSAVMGGQITSYYLYTSESETSFHDVSAKVSVEVRYLVGKTNVDVGGGYRQFAESNNVFIKNTLDVLGGTDLGMLSDADIGKNYLNWEKSLDDHASLIGIKDTSSLVPIWNLIDDVNDNGKTYTWTDVDGNIQYGTRKQQLEGYFMSYGVENYNTLLKNTGLPEIKAPTDITNVRVNEKTAGAGDVFEVYTGINNSIDFNVEPYDATGYTKSASLSTTTDYAEITTKDGIQLYISPDMPNNSTFDVILSAGNIRKTIKVRVVKRCMVNFVTNCDQELAPYTNLIYGQQIDEPADLTKYGYRFIGWYKDPSYKEETKYNFGEEPILNDITLYARWEKIKPVVAFDSKGGSEVASQNVAYGGCVTKPGNPNRTGYNFINWFADTDCTVTFDFDTEITESITLYAGWEIITYTVTLMTNTVPEEIILTTDINKNYRIEQPEITKPYYDFNGWYKDEGFTQKFYFESSVTNGMRLYAKWTPSVITVEFLNSKEGDMFDAEGNKIATKLTTDIEKGFKIDSAYVKEPVMEGYKFLGWYYNNNLVDFSIYEFKPQSGDNTETMESITLYAGWEIITYTVTLMTNTVPEEIILTTDINKNYRIEQPEITKPYYDFSGWYKDEGFTQKFYFESAVTNGMRLYAKWTPSVITVEFLNLQEGEMFDAEGNKIVTKLTTDIEKEFKIDTSCMKDPVWEGHKFLGWYYNNNVIDLSEYEFKPKSTYNIDDFRFKLYAKWDRYYFIAFKYVYEDGTIYKEDTLSLQNGQEYNVVSDVLEGYTPTQESIVGTVQGKDVSYEIIYKRNSYSLTVNYVDSQNNIITEEELIFKYNDCIEISTPKGYTIVSSVMEKMPAHNETISVVCSRNEYQIRFNPNNGNAIETKTIYYGDSLPAITVPEFKGYDFLGYYDNDKTLYYNAKGESVVEKYMSEDGIELNAKWQAHLYTIEVNIIDVNQFTNNDTKGNPEYGTNGISSEHVYNTIKLYYTYVDADRNIEQGYYTNVALTTKPSVSTFGEYDNFVFGGLFESVISNNGHTYAFYDKNSCVLLSDGTFVSAPSELNETVVDGKNATLYVLLIPKQYTIKLNTNTQVDTYKYSPKIEIDVALTNFDYTTSVKAYYNEVPENIKVMPESEYYQPKAYLDSTSKSYFNSDGTGIAYYNFSCDTEMYCEWEHNSKYNDYNYVYNSKTFEEIKNNLNAKYLLLNDIDLGQWNNPFEFFGTFDGTGKKISYFQTLGTESVSYGGLFTILNDAVVKNLYIDGQISAPKKDNTVRVGVLAGSTTGKNSISCVSVTGTIKLTDGVGMDCLGGVIGEFYGGSIDQCASSVELESHAFEAVAGGIVGYARASEINISITNCYNTGHIKSCTGYIKGHRSAGGIVGRIKGHDVFVFEISNCYNDSIVETIQEKNAAMGWWGCGGIFGDIDNSVSTNITVSSSYWNSSIHKPYGNNKEFHNSCGKADMTGTYSNWSQSIWEFSNSEAPKLLWMR